MRNLLMWVGQKVLTGVWLLCWPCVVWRWASSAKFLPHKVRRTARLQCVTGSAMGAVFLTLAIFNWDYGWILDGLYMYVPVAFFQIRKIRVLTQRYAKVRTPRRLPRG